MGYRKEKLEEQIRRIVSELLMREIKDPRIGFATITRAELSKDFSIVRVGVSVMGNARDLRRTLEGLRSAEPFIQHRLGKALGIRVTPKVTFYLDPSIAEGVKMVQMLTELEEAESKSQPDTDVAHPDAGTDDTSDDGG